MGKSAVIFNEIFLKHDLPSHPENATRLHALLKTLPSFNIPILDSKPVDMQLLKLAHEEKYIREIEKRCQGFEGHLDPDTYYNEHSYYAALMAAGAVEKAVNLCFKENYNCVLCAVRPPGHHAERGRSMGFCIFNNVVVGALHALTSGFKKVFIIDFDAHHGNGTQHILADNPHVFYFSSHQYPFYPGTGSENENNEHIYNAPLSSGAGDKEIKQVYGEILPALINKFQPEILLVSAGFDLHEDDPLTNLKVTDEGVKFILETLVMTAREKTMPIIFTLEGGYNLQALERCGEIMFRLM